MGAFQMLQNNYWACAFRRLHYWAGSKGTASLLRGGGDMRLPLSGASLSRLEEEKRIELGQLWPQPFREDKLENY